MNTTSMKSWPVLSSVAIAALLLTGCSLTPEMRRLEAPIPQTWAANVAARPAAAATPEWQDFVIDAQAKHLVETALENNRDLRQTLLNIQVVRAQYRVQRADQLPALGAQASGTRQRTPGDLSASGSSSVSNNFQAGLGVAAFELDLFGRVASLSQAALQEYLATEEAGKTAKLSLIAEVLQAHLTRDSAQRRLELTQLTLQARERSLELITERRKGGASNAVDHEEAVGLAEQARADLERAGRELAQASNALTLLVGDHQAVGQVASGTDTRPALVRDLVPGLPADLIARRPDILAAEHRLRARNADIGAARAAFFPRISLTGFLGSSSAEMSRLFESGQSAWSFNPQLSIPIFDAGRNRANLDIAKVRADIAVANYEATIQGAFREVSDALVATDALRREESARKVLAKSSERAMQLSEARYRAGVDSHLRYLDAQRSNYSNQVALIEVEAQRQAALVSLFRALGGAWSKSVPASS